MIENLITNWRTTSAGVTLIITNGVHLAMAVKSGSANENTWVLSLTGIVTGIGLILAGDASQSAKQTDTLTAQVKAAIDTGDTTHLAKKP